MRQALENAESARRVAAVDSAQFLVIADFLRPGTAYLVGANVANGARVAIGIAGRRIRGVRATELLIAFVIRTRISIIANQDKACTIADFSAIARRTRIAIIAIRPVRCLADLAFAVEQIALADVASVWTHTVFRTSRLAFAVFAQIADRAQIVVIAGRPAQFADLTAQFGIANVIRTRIAITAPNGFAFAIPALAPVFVGAFGPIVARDTVVQRACRTLPALLVATIASTRVLVIAIDFAARLAGAARAHIALGAQIAIRIAGFAVIGDLGAAFGHVATVRRTWVFVVAVLDAARHANAVLARVIFGANAAVRVAGNARLVGVAASALAVANIGCTNVFVIAAALICLAVAIVVHAIANLRHRRRCRTPRQSFAFTRACTCAFARHFAVGILCFNITSGCQLFRHRLGRTSTSPKRQFAAFLRQTHALLQLSAFCRRNFLTAKIFWTIASIAATYATKPSQSTFFNAGRILQTKPLAIL